MASDEPVDRRPPRTVSGAVIGRRGGLDVLTWPLFADQPIDAVVTTRSGGVSTGPYATLNLGLHVGDDGNAVVENRRRAAATVGLGLDELVFCNQAHGRAVAHVDTGDRGRGARRVDDAVPGADALLTRSPDVGLVVMMADCVPIVVFDPGTRTLACVHAGWRGTVAGVVTETVAAFTSEGASARDLLVGIGPAVASHSYQVGEEVVVAARDGLGDDTDAVVRSDGTGRWTFDLWEANHRLLERAGVRPDNISLAAWPTGGDGPFFSDRDERPCGRFAALARIRPSGG